MSLFGECQFCRNSKWFGPCPYCSPFKPTQPDRITYVRPDEKYLQEIFSQRLFKENMSKPQPKSKHADAIARLKDIIKGKKAFIEALEMTIEQLEYDQAPSPESGGEGK